MTSRSVPGVDRERFRAWRRSRPFWAGVLMVLAAAATAGAPLGPLTAMLAAGPAAVSGLAFGAIYLGAAATFWFAPQQRVFVAFSCAVLAVASFALSNFGGLGVGMLCALVGSSMAFGWRPGTALAAVALAGLLLVTPTGAPPAAAAAVRAAIGTPEHAPQRDASTVTIAGMHAKNLRVLGARTLRTPTGPRSVLLMHADTVVLDDYLLRTDQSGPQAAIGFDMTVHDVDLYMQELSGSVELGPLRVPVALDAGTIPQWLPVDVTIPDFVVRGVRAQQALVVAPHADVTGLRMGVAASVLRGQAAGIG